VAQDKEKGGDIGKIWGIKEGVGGDRLSGKGRAAALPDERIVTKQRNSITDSISLEQAKRNRAKAR
jgi:hypothetical protein